MIENKIFDEKTIKALKSCILGLTTIETTTEYATDDNGDLKVVKKKVQEKSIPPNVDLIKLIYQHLVEDEKDYEKMSDEELEREKQKLIKQLKEENDDSRKVKSKSKM